MNNLFKKTVLYITNKKLLPAIILAMVILFHLFININYQINNNGSTTWDDSWHSAISFTYYQQLTGHQVNLEQHYPLVYERFTKYPPLVWLTPLPLYFIFGLSAKIAAFSITFYFLLAIILTYLIGKEIYNKKIGLLSAVLFSFFPIIFGMSRLYFLDLPIVTMVCGTIYFLLKYRKTEQKKYIFWSLIFVILGLLTKQIFIIFVFPVFLYVLYDTHRDRIKTWLCNKKTLLLILISAISITLLSFLYFYIFSGEYLLWIFIYKLSFSGFINGLTETISSFYNIQTTYFFP